MGETIMNLYLYLHSRTCATQPPIAGVCVCVCVSVACEYGGRTTVYCYALCYALCRALHCITLGVPPQPAPFIVVSSRFVSFPLYCIAILLMCCLVVNLAWLNPTQPNPTQPNLPSYITHLIHLCVCVCDIWRCVLCCVVLRCVCVGVRATKNGHYAVLAVWFTCSSAYVRKCARVLTQNNQTLRRTDMILTLYRITTTMMVRSE